jgi:hypothetical protein
MQGNLEVEGPVLEIKWKNKAAVFLAEVSVA